MATSCFLKWKEIQFRWSRWLSEGLVCKIFSWRELLNKAEWRRISYDLEGVFSSSAKLKLQFVSGQQKAADYVKMLNDLSLAKEGCHLCGEEWIFQQDNAAIQNLSITKYLLEQKIRLLDHPACSPDFYPIENCRDWLLQKFMKEVDSISELKNAILDTWEKIPSVQLQKLVDSMLHWIFEVIKAKCGSTKYLKKTFPLYSIVLFISLIFMSKQNFKIKCKR